MIPYNYTIYISVTCQQFESFPHGQINCSGNKQQLQFEDYCSFQCSDGFELEGSAVRWCGANGKWNGTKTQCNIRHCVDIRAVVPNSRSCNTSYSSTCMVECEDGYNRLGDSSKYSCDLNGTDVMWMGTGSGVTCSPGLCVCVCVCVCVHACVCTCVCARVCTCVI